MRVFHSISKDRITTISGGVTFFVLLALFPGLAGLISLYGLIADTNTIHQHVSNLDGVLPEGGMQILRDQQQLTSDCAYGRRSSGKDESWKRSGLSPGNTFIKRMLIALAEGCGRWHLRAFGVS